MQHTGLLAVEIGQFHPVHKLQDAIVSAVYIRQREVPVDSRIELVLVDLLGDLCKFAVADVATVTDDAGEEDFLGRLRSLVFRLPMLEFIEKASSLIHRSERFEQGNVLPFREEGAERKRFYFIEFRRAYMEAT